MKLQAHFIADVAQFDSEGLVTVIRGGINQAMTDAFPGMVRFSTLTRLWLTPEEASGLVMTRTRLTLDSSEIAQSSQPLNVNKTNPDYIFVNLINNFQLVIPHPCLLRIETSVTAPGLESALPLLEFVVKRAPGV